MSESQPVRILHEDKAEEVRVIELSTTYEGAAQLYHAVSSKIVIFENGQLYLQWSQGLQAPVMIPLTFEELDALIEQFNTYCEDYQHPIAEPLMLVPNANGLLDEW